MARSYSILVLPQRGTQIRRFLLTPRLLFGLFGGGAALLGLCGWVVSDYVSVKLHLRAVTAQFEGMGMIDGEIQSQRERLFSLQEMAGNIQDLLDDWKGLQKNVRSSLPAKRRPPPDGPLPLDELEKSLATLRGELERLVGSVPTGWPATGRISSGVGMRKNPWTQKPEFHSGLDIPKPTGTPVYAPGGAVVEHVGRSKANGNTVILNHGQGITTLYAHLSKIHVTKGQQVEKGQLIAAVGNTGKSTSSHLHYEVRVNGIPIDPRRNLIQGSSPSS